MRRVALPLPTSCHLCRPAALAACCAPAPPLARAGRSGARCAPLRARAQHLPPLHRPVPAPPPPPPQGVKAIWINAGVMLAGMGTCVGVFYGVWETPYATQAKTLACWFLIPLFQVGASRDADPMFPAAASPPRQAAQGRVLCLPAAAESSRTRHWHVSTILFTPPPPLLQFIVGMAMASVVLPATRIYAPLERTTGFSFGEWQRQRLARLPARGAALCAAAQGSCAWPGPLDPMLKPTLHIPPAPHRPSHPHPTPTRAQPTTAATALWAA